MSHLHNLHMTRHLNSSMINLESKFQALGRNTEFIFFQSPTPLGFTNFPACSSSRRVCPSNNREPNTSGGACPTSELFFPGRAKVTLPGSSLQKTGFQAVFGGSGGCAKSLPEPAHPPTWQLGLCRFHLRFHSENGFSC